MMPADLIFNERNAATFGSVRDDDCRFTLNFFGELNGVIHGVKVVAGNRTPPNELPAISDS